jgi:RimJ/RimL family protein N-acetyltransferase
MQSDVVVPGERVYLGPMRRDLAPLYREWANDLEVATKIGVITQGSFPLTDEDEVAWFDGLRSSRSSVAFGIYERETGDPIGVSQLGDIRSIYRRAEFGIFIGSRENRGRGYGTEATRLTLDYGFTVLGLHLIWLNCSSINTRAIRVYQKAGFRESGCIREAGQWAGKRFDAVFMDILAREFESPVLADMLGEPARDYGDTK